MKPIRKAKTPLLASLQRAFRIALRSKQENTPSSDELLDMYREGSGFTRRKFITDSTKAAMFVAAGSLILPACKKEDDLPVPADGNGSTSENSQSRRPNQPRIVIVGGGIAGLNCAYQLKKSRYDATVYEGSTRIGGRMYTASNIIAQGLKTELGGEFIDTAHTDLLGLASEFGFSLIDTQAPSQSVYQRETYFFNGQHYTEQQVINEFSLYAGIIQHDIDSLPGYISYFNPGNAAALDNTSIAQYLTNIGMTGWLRELIEVAYLTEYGRETEDQSSINFLYLISTDTSRGFEIFGDSDERYKILGGNQQIPIAIANNLGNHVVYDHKLDTIKENADGTYKLTFLRSNASTVDVTADIVVMAIPFTLLREVNIQVALPGWKLNAINNLGYGTNAKLMIGFNNRPWNVNGHAGYAFTDQSFQNGWENSLLQGGSSGGYTMFFGGNTGVASGAGSPASQAAIHMPGMELVYPGSAAHMSGNIQRMHWPTHPWTKASYACYRPGQFTTVSGAEKKAVRNMVFAGEHCSWNFQGYMNGGAETGRAASEKVLELLSVHA